MAYESKEKEWKAEFIYIVDIKVIKGIELQTTECDAYIKIESGNHEFTTNTQNTSNPEWNETTQFLFYKEPRHALLSLLESNKHSLIGKHTLKLTPLFDSDSIKKECIELQLLDAKRGKIEINVNCTRLDPFKIEEKTRICTEKLKKCDEEIRRCDAQINNCTQTYNTLKYDITAYNTERKGIHDGCTSKRDELTQYQIDGEKCDADIKKIEAECNHYDKEYTMLKKQKKNVFDRIRDYGRNLGKIESEDEDQMDVDLYGDILYQYRTADRNAKHTDINKAKCRADGNTDKYHQEDQKYNIHKEKADKCLNEISKWKTRCDQEYQLLQEECLHNLDYSAPNQKRWFSNYYIALNKLCFNLQIVAATLDIFSDDIKRLTAKRISKCTLDDLGKKTEGKRSSLWQILYANNLDFVIFELDKMYPIIIRNKSIKNLCDKSNTFILSRYNGYFCRFCKLIAHWVLQLMLENNIPPNSKLLDDAICAVILLLNDKKGFCITLHRLMKESEELEDDDDCDRYERVVCSIIIAISRLWDSALVDDILDSSVEKEIEKELDDVLEQCTALKINNKSQQLIIRFFSYFFRPEKGAICCGGSDTEGVGWVGKIFGSLCSK